MLLLLQVIDHYENPRNVGSLDKNDKSVGTGLVGAPACGDVMKLQVSAVNYSAQHIFLFILLTCCRALTTDGPQFAFILHCVAQIGNYK